MYYYFFIYYKIIILFFFPIKFVFWTEGWNGKVMVEKQ